MKNEIGRKITSLTLMTIMVAGGLTFAIPGIMPQALASHNANLFVSAENAAYNNFFGGPQVIEIVISDDNIRTLDDVHGQPDVTVNGAKLLMIQATDGNWYAYVADRNQAQIADETTVDAAGKIGGTGLDFGILCGDVLTGVQQPGSNAATIDLTDTTGLAIPTTDATTGGGNGTDTTSFDTCELGDATTLLTNINNVVREFKSPSNSTTNRLGQVGLNVNAWPLIQLFNFDFTGNVVIQYNKGGDPQSTTLTFDTSDADQQMMDADRVFLPLGAELHFTITDHQLNIDPTDEDSWTFATDSGTDGVHYQLFDENGNVATNVAALSDSPNISGTLASLQFEDNGILTITTDAQGVGQAVILFDDNNDQILEDGAAKTAEGGTELLAAAAGPTTMTELGPNSGIFANYDESDDANLDISTSALRGTSATIDYNGNPLSFVAANFWGTIDMDDSGIGGEWNSGEEIPITLIDEDNNLNTRADEDLDVNNPSTPLIPALQIGSPITLVTDDSGAVTLQNGDFLNDPLADLVDIGTVNAFSQRAVLNVTSTTTLGADTILNATFTGTDMEAMSVFLEDGTSNAIFHFFNYDIRSFESTFNSQSFTIDLTNTTGNAVEVISAGTTDYQGLIDISAIVADTIGGDDDVIVTFAFGAGGNAITAGDQFSMVADFFSFGTSGDGVLASDRTNNAIYRIELEETGDNTSTFVGTVEYIMLNQLNINQSSTYTALVPISDEISIIVHEDLTDEDSVRINYFDLGADGVATQVADQQEAPTHSGVVSFDSTTYKVADTVVVTLEDQDLNADSDLVDIFTVVTDLTDTAGERVGRSGYGSNSLGDPFGTLLFITFDDELWAAQAFVNSDGASCGTAFDTFNDGLTSTGFTLVETDAASGVFVGDFQIPDFYCKRSGESDNTAGSATTTGTDMEVNYLDYRDASGEIIEVGDSSGVRANTGSISLDRTVYPVPFGVPADALSLTGETPNGRSVFLMHKTGLAVDPDSTLSAGEFISNGDLTIHVRVNDPDEDLSATGEDNIDTGTNGPVKITISRGADILTLATAGGAAESFGFITTGSTVVTSGARQTTELGPITEIAPDAGIFELDMTIRYTDGPISTKCPTTDRYTNSTGGAQDDVLDRFDTTPTSGSDYCILQGDIITVEYTDPTDASGNPNTVTDSATFDLRNGVLQSDKSVYIIGSDLILTLIEPDLDLENDAAETYDLDLIEWDSDAATIPMGNLGTAANAVAFDPEPSDFRETGDSTGIFQIVIEIPSVLSSDNLERGEEIVLEYTDWGPSGADFVGDEDEDINLTIFTSNFGATVELDQKVYTWTDKVYITIVAPDHNFDSDLVDEIGETSLDPVKVSTRGKNLKTYKLVETGTDTGIFTGEVILTGFPHDADGDSSTGTIVAGIGGSDVNPVTGTAIGGTASGPTDGFLETDDDDGITVSFEFSEDETVVGSALIRWNIGETQWLEASYPASGTGVVRIIDPDMNLNPESVDNFNVDVWSDSDAGGIDLTVTETNEATGIFEGTVFFTTTDESAGHRLRVAEGDTITAEYEDNTLPDPYTTADELDITGTSLIGTIVPPLERAPAANARVVDAFGNALVSVSVDQQVQITADLANGQDRDQLFAYLVQVQDFNGVTISLAWITGSLAAGQSFSPALSWTPDAPGTYTATVFVWESVNNPTALSPPTSVDISVS